MRETRTRGGLRRALAGLTRNVFLLGLISFLTDASSEMIFPLMPVFLALASVGQGMPVAVLVGILEGTADTVSALLKLGAGVWTDRVRKKKPLILAGYGLSSLARPLVAFATAWWHPLAVRVADRIGKGIRSAPRDVLIAESTPGAYRGKAFGFHRSMDHSGAVVGPLIATVLLLSLGRPGFSGADHESLLRTIFLLSLLPGLISLAAIVFWLREKGGSEGKAPFRLSLRGFNASYLYYLASLLLFTLGNSTDMFLVYRAAEIVKSGHGAFQGVWAVALIPLMWAFFHACKMAFVAPLGALSDRIGRKKPIGLGWMVYAAVYLGFAFMNRAWQAWPLFAVYALYYGLTEGAEKALVVDLAPRELRGTALGLYHLVLGIATLPASVVFGLVYAKSGALVAFGYAAVLALAAAALFSCKVRERRPVTTG